MIQYAALTAFNRDVSEYWMPAFAGMTTETIDAIALSLRLLRRRRSLRLSCRCLHRLTIACEEALHDNEEHRHHQ
jgi:hypothetical protein